VYYPYIKCLDPVYFVGCNTMGFKLLALAVLGFRLLNALLTWTYAAPDELWQAPEVAHKLVFGNGYM
jgi:hypothetical protein